MKSLSVLELSKLYNINRQTIYNNINKGILSKNSDNKIDLSEAIRILGEPIKKQSIKENVKLDSPKSSEFLLLRQQIDMLKSQLNDAKDRESFYQTQIETMQRLLEAPKPNIPISSHSEFIADEKNSDIASNNLSDTELKKKGFWKRFFLPHD
jgi:predicted DNA-binding protein YlxM (UPF0122 family)